MPFVGHGMLIFLRLSARGQYVLHQLYILPKPSSSTTMLMVAIVPCRIEIPVFVHVQGDI